MANELYRQSVHVAYGVACGVAAFLLPKSAFLWIVGSALLVTLGLFFIWRSKWLDRLLERDDAAFRGKGALFFLLGVLFTAALFWEHAGLAILLLAIPDAFATLVGTMYRSPKLPYNRNKSVAGSVAFFASSLLVLSVAYQSLAVVFIAFLLTALESFDYREIPFLDDNLVIPVVAAYLLTFL